MNNQSHSQQVNNENNILFEEYKSVFGKDSYQMAGEDLLDSLNRFFILHQASPASATILKIIKTTHDFMNETNPDFKVARDLNISDENIIHRFDRHAEDLEHLLAVAKQEAPHEQIIERALMLCIHIIKQRLDELQTLDKRIYNLYLTRDNALRPLLKKVYSR